MTVIEVEDIKKFMAILFKGDAFDRFLLVDAEIKMSVTYRIEGRLNKSFFDTDENSISEQSNGLGQAADGAESNAVPQEFARWEAMKTICTDMIKGKRLPVRMRITLKKPVVNEADGQFNYVLNIMYEAGKLQLLTNVSAVNFTLERPDGEKWDNTVLNILKKNEIVNFVSTQ